MPRLSLRPTMRSIAAAAGVSPMAVSLALRDDPSVSARTRARIQRIARAKGYRPDPMLTQLMQHLRTQRTPKAASNLAVLTMLDAGFVRRLLQGARARAEQLGYNLDPINLRQNALKAAPLTRMLLARGVAGVLLAPTMDVFNLSGLLDWSRFAAVAMTYSVVEPHVHRVVTHHFDNAVRAFAILQERGFKRIGLAMTSDMEFRANHSYSAAYYRAARTSDRTPMPVLLFDRTDAGSARGWFTRHQPDAVVVANAHQVQDYLLPALAPRARATMAVVCLDTDRLHPVSGIDQLFETVGSHAIDALIAQIHRGERGLPKHPTVAMVEGRWDDAYGYFPLARM